MIVIVVSVLVVAVVSDGADVFSVPWCGQCGVIVSEMVVIFVVVVVVVVVAVAVDVVVVVVVVVVCFRLV